MGKHGEPRPIGHWLTRTWA